MAGSRSRSLDGGLPRCVSVPARILIVALAAAGWACAEPRQPFPGDSGPQADGGQDAGPVADAGPWINATGNLAGMTSECGNLAFVAAKPDEDVVLAGVAQRGVWAQTAPGAAWQPLGQGAGSDVITNRTSSFVFDPSHPATYWEGGLYNGPGVYRTDDDGATFHSLGSAIHTDLVSVDLGDPLSQTMLAGGHEQQGRLQLSTDGGAGWTDIGGGLPTGIGNSSAPLVLDSHTFLLGTWGTAAAGVFRSTDAGQSWAKVSVGGVLTRPATGSNGSLFWLLESGAGIIHSSDSGLSWTRRGGNGTLTPPQGGTGTGLIQLPDQSLVSIAVAKLVRSRDLGATWQEFGPPLPFAPQGVAYAAIRKRLLIWHFSCSGASEVPEDAILEAGFDYLTQ